MNKSAEETILLTNKDPDPGSMFQDMMKGNNNNSITNGNDSKSASMNVFTGLNAMAGGMNHKTYSIIFDPGEQASLITFYVFIMILGLLFNAAIIWVIVGELLLTHFRFICLVIENDSCNFQPDPTTGTRETCTLSTLPFPVSSCASSASLQQCCKFSMEAGGT